MGVNDELYISSGQAFNEILLQVINRAIFAE